MNFFYLHQESSRSDSKKRELARRCEQLEHRQVHSLPENTSARADRVHARTSPCRLRQLDQWHIGQRRRRRHRASHGDLRLHVPGRRGVGQFDLEPPGSADWPEVLPLHTVLLVVSNLAQAVWMLQIFSVGRAIREEAWSWRTEQLWTVPRWCNSPILEGCIAQMRFSLLLLWLWIFICSEVNKERNSPYWRFCTSSQPYLKLTSAHSWRL